MAFTVTGLEDLVADEKELNQEILHGVLEGIVKISKNGTLIPRERWSELSSIKKVAVALLGLKAMAYLEISDSEGTGPTGISNISGIKKGTAAPKLRELEDKGLAVNEDGKYRIPNFRLREIKAFIESDDK